MPDIFDILSLRFFAVLPQVVSGLAVAGVFWLLARFTGGLVMRFQASVADDHKNLVVLLADVTGWTLFAIGVIAGLGTAGVDVAALVTGLGLIGFAIGFAVRDILANMVSGILIMLFRPYGRGDKVRIDKFQGTVVEVDLRYTTLQATGAKVLIPNAKAYTEIVAVLSDDAEPHTDAKQSTDAKQRTVGAPALSVKAAAKPTRAS